MMAGIQKLVFKFSNQLPACVFYDADCFYKLSQIINDMVMFALLSQHHNTEKAVSLKHYGSVYVAAYCSLIELVSKKIISRGRWILKAFNHQSRVN